MAVTQATLDSSRCLTSAYLQGGRGPGHLGLSYFRMELGSLVYV